MKIIAALNNVQQSISALYNDNYSDVFTYAKNFILMLHCAMQHHFGRRKEIQKKGRGEIAPSSDLWW